MAKIAIYNQAKKEVASLTLSTGWDSRIKRADIFETALWHTALRRSGTAAAKSRSQVRGSGRKIYRQKGTGNARHADRQAPIFVGGGVAHGPQSRDWSYELPRKQRRGAIQSVLIHKLRQDKLRVLESFDFVEIKTKQAKEFFSTWKVDSALVVLDQYSEKVIKSIRNLPRFKATSVRSLNVADLLAYDFIFATKDALQVIETSWMCSVEAKEGEQSVVAKTES